MKRTQYESMDGVYTRDSSPGKPLSTLGLKKFKGGTVTETERE